MLGDGCREPSSAHRNSALPATNPSECIWQQYARQQIAATYHATCPVHAAGHTTVSKQPGYLLPLIPPWRYRRGSTDKSYSRGTTAVHAAGILPCDGSRAQRAGDSDVGANNKGAGDDPGDWVDAH